MNANNIKKDINSFSRIILFGFRDDFLSKIANKISDQYVINFFSWTNDKLEKSNPNVFEVFILCKPLLLKRYIYQSYKENEYLAFKQKYLSIQNEFKECKSYFRKMLKRVFIRKLNEKEINEYFLNLLFFWYKKLDSNDIKLIIFESTPHFPWDIIAFFYAKQINIKILILRRTLISDKIIFSDDFRESKTKIIKNYNPRHNEISIQNAIKNSYWDEYSKKLIKNRLNNNKAKFILITKIIHVLKTYLKTIKNLKNSYYNLNFLSYSYYVFLHFFKQLYLRRIWKKNIISSFTTKNYVIYFPLHFQPERSTDPEAGDYSNQFKAIEILSKIIPSEWEIWVKEHPRQNPVEYPNIRRFHYRSNKDYYQLIKLKNVKLLDVDVPSSEILEICKVVASCTGSILWEGLLKNKIVIRFGSTWHDNCKSCFYIEEILKNKNFFDEVLKINKNQITKDLEEFIFFISDYVITSSNSDLFAKKSDKSEDILISNFVTFIRSYIDTIKI